MLVIKETVYLCMKVGGESFPTIRYYDHNISPSLGFRYDMSGYSAGVVGVSVQWPCLTFLDGGSLLHFLDKQVEHLRLHELLDEMPRAFGLDGFIEAPLVELRRRVRSVPHHMFGKMADRFDEERQEGFGNDAVHFLQT